MTDDHFQQLHTSLQALALEVGGLREATGGVKEATEQLSDRFGAIEADVREIQLREARRKGAESATREIATKAGAAGARRESRRDRLITTAISLMAVLLSAAGYALPR